MISPILAKLYRSILEKKIDTWLESHGKIARGQVGFKGHHSTVDHLLHLGSLQRSVVMIKLIFSVVLLILEKLLTLCPGLTSRIG
jgi:hypothetical protein